MKKLFTSFISLMTIGTFSQCGFKNNDTTQSSSSAVDNQKVEKPKQQVATKTTSSSSSSSVKSSTRNQYLRKSHEEWIADSITTMTSKLKDNADYKEDFKTWKISDDGQNAKIDAYINSKAKTLFSNWLQQKGTKRDSDEFVNQIAKNTETASYKIYQRWIQSPKGKSEMQALYKIGLPIYDKNYGDWETTMNAKRPRDYANSEDSNPAFAIWIKSDDAKTDLEATYKGHGSYYQSGYDAWKNLEANYKSKNDYVAHPSSTLPFNTWRGSTDGLRVLKPLFAQSGNAYTTAYNTWRGNLDSQKNKYIDSDGSNTDYDTWRKNAGRNALKNFWYATTTGSNSFKDAVKNWDGQGSTNVNLATSETYANDQVPTYGTAPKAAVINWLDTTSAITLFRNEYPTPLFYDDSELRTKLKQATTFGVGTQGSTRAPLRRAFLAALKDPDAHSDLATTYNQWKEPKYKDADNTQNQNRDLDLWTADKKTTTNPNIKGAFKTAIGATSAFETNFNTWVGNNLNDRDYKNSDTYETDTKEWARDKKSQTSPQDVKAKFIEAMGQDTDGGNRVLKGTYDGWKIKSQTDYETTNVYRDDISKWAHKKRFTPVTAEDFDSSLEIHESFVIAMGSSTPGGDKVLKDKFDEWKRPSDNKYRSSQTYLTNVAQYLNLGRSEAIVKAKIKAILALDNPPGVGNQVLKDEFIAWQPTSKENFVKSEAIGSDFDTWSSSLNEVDLTVLDQISKILKDKDLFTNEQGNSKFIKSLKEITKAEYDAYILTL